MGVCPHLGSAGSRWNGGPAISGPGLLLRARMARGVGRGAITAAESQVNQEPQRHLRTVAATPRAGGHRTTLSGDGGPPSRAPACATWESARAENPCLETMDSAASAPSDTPVDRPPRSVSGTGWGPAPVATHSVDPSLRGSLVKANALPRGGRCSRTTAGPHGPPRGRSAPPYPVLPATDRRLLAEQRRAGLCSSGHAGKLGLCITLLKNDLAEKRSHPVLPLFTPD